MFEVINSSARYRTQGVPQSTNHAREETHVPERVGRALDSYLHTKSSGKMLAVRSATRRATSNLYLGTCQRFPSGDTCGVFRVQISFTNTAVLISFSTYEQ